MTGEMALALAKKYTDKAISGGGGKTKNTYPMANKSIDTTGNSETIVSYKQILPMPYIQGNGSSYFDTGLMWTDTTKIEFEFKVLNSNHYYEWVWGLCSNGKILGISSRNIGNNSFRIMLGDSGENNNMTVDYVSVYHLIFDNVTKKVTVINNGAEYQINSEFVTNNIIPILCLNRDNTFINACSNAFRLYNFNIYENDVPIRNYVPAKDDNDIACLFDKLSRTFLYDATSANTFEYGEDFVL